MPSPRPPARSLGFSSVSRKTSASTVCVGLLTEAEDPQRHPWLVGGDGEHDRGSVARTLSEGRGARRVEPCGHEDRAARARRSRAPPARRASGSTRARGPRCRRRHRRPSRMVMSSASIWVVEQHLGIARRGSRRAVAANAFGGATSCWRRCRVQLAAPFDGGRHVGERDDRTDFRALAGELERRDVALDAVVVRGECARADELERSVLTDETAACAGRCCERDPRSAAPRQRWRRVSSCSGVESISWRPPGGSIGLVTQSVRRWRAPISSRSPPGSPPGSLPGAGAP